MIHSPEINDLIKIIACSLPVSLRIVAPLTWEEITVYAKNLPESGDKQKLGCGD